MTSVLLTKSLQVEFEAVPFQLEQAEDGTFVAHNDDLRVAAHGDDAEAATESFLEGVRELILFCSERQLPLPAPIPRP